ncbi:hypothetical protein SELMODRAFT_137082 [Selaginella moellendorffii]|uniref:ABC transporter domain-containing protein n=1 Tax=Selaginella moellendorffii TaxID=88036 RepID=D8TCU2_SELML|nr:hypothetical protein SELMODRAFT_137082 [Selaginella moellendorffii]
MAQSVSLESLGAWANELQRSRSTRSGSVRNWRLSSDSVFGQSVYQQHAEDDEEALKWAAIERLPTYDRLGTTILTNYVEGNRLNRQVVSIENIGPVERQEFINKLIQVTEEDNEKFLRKLRKRIDRVSIQLPTIEVRFQDVTVQADCYLGTRALPTLWNATRNTIEGILDVSKLLPMKKTSMTMLRNVSGIIKPGRMTLLLGPPGSGKTSLLLALAGKLDPALKVEGQISYNGHSLEEFVPQKTSAYISQHDFHLGELTVRETLEFSSQCQGVGARYEMLAELARREKQAGIFPEADIDFFMKATAVEGLHSSLVTEYSMKILGLDLCADTLVGDDMLRGISGGQKKRVTTGEMIVGPTRTLFMDEISTGLDSSTTFQIVKCLQQFVHLLESTVLMSLLQPAPETFELFDDIILLSEGQIVYQGPRELVLEFFEACGFKCPERKGVADFLQELTSQKDQAQYWWDETKPYEYVSVNDFVQLFKQSRAGELLAEEFSCPFDKERSHKAALEFSKYAIGGWDLFKVCFAREWLLVKRNSFIFIFKGVQICIVAFIGMTVFLRTEMHRDNEQDGFYFLGALFFTLIMIMFNGFGELPMTLTRLPIFYKQRDLLFYPSWAFALPMIVSRIPMSIVEVTIFIAMTYYVIGFAPAAGRFFRQYLLLFVLHQMSSAMFRFIAGVCRTMVVANTGGSVALLIVFMLGGFIIPRAEIPKWWIWGYWISPLTYAENAISVNEMLAPEWDKQVPGRNMTLGKAILQDRGLFTEANWYWIGVGGLIGFVFLFNVLFTLALAHLNPLSAKRALSEQPVSDQKRILSSRRESMPSEHKHSNRTGLALIPDVLHASASTSSRQLSDRRGMILPFQPLAIAFKDIKYYVDMPAEMKSQGLTESRLELLHDITGAFRPGVLTALMGVSGAGKTTLMDVLAGRKTSGYIEGDIWISGFPKKQETFARISGYCEQSDIHSPQVTIYESLLFSARLRLPNEVDRNTQELFVHEVMELVELDIVKDALVGIPGVSGLSTEQRKRLTIAVELVANPSIIFMDEPTSGLDARAAAIVMRTVRNTVDTGRTVVCTIHQPSIDIFEAFDELLLLKRGGQVTYAGPLGKRSHKLIEYFEAVPGVTRYRDGTNPAAWMLEVTSPSTEHSLNTDFAQLYLNSPLFQRNIALVKELSSPAPGASDLYFPTKYSQPFLTQFRSCLWKQNLTYWRSPDYNCVRLCFTLFSALLFGTIFWKFGLKRENQSDLLNVMGAMYGAVIFLGVNNSATVQPVVATERTVFYRERAAGMYSALPYALAQVIVEIPYVLFQTLMYGGITYAMIQFEWKASKFFWYLYVMFFTFLYFTYYGMMAVAITPNYQIAGILASAFYSLFNLFSGFLIPKPKIPKWWQWYVWICPVAYTVYGLITSQYGDVNSELQIPGQPSKPIKLFLKDYFDYDQQFLGVVAAVLFGFAAFFAFMFAFCIRVLNFQRR